MTTKHTPGPWSVPDGGMAPTICTADESTLIATLAGTGDEMEANAALMKAAPEMLAALRLWHAALRGKAMSAEEQAAWNAGRAAIAKAEGRG